ncbi:MAG: hypothetical protein V7K21_20245 [Nostoc sp.]|uniref:hypothetical protein n=1 Tax=Nostoc sp. TaxID=1180 RepID=UPI002FF8669C
MPKKIDWEEIRKYWQQTGASSNAIADHFGVSKRSVDDRIPQWRTTEKPASNVIQLQPKPKAQNPRLDFRRHDGEPIDDLFAVEAAITHLHDSLPAALDQSKGGIAGAIARLIELKRKLKPETVADLVERAIELDISPEEFLTELNNAWQRRRA